MNISESKIRVRYAETDQMGVVYHANYYVWFEVGRADFLRQANMTYKDMEAKGIIMPVVETNCKYKLPAMYDDNITIRTVVRELRYASITFSYTVIRDIDNTVLAEGKTIHAFTNNEMKPINLKKGNPEVFELLNKIISEDI